MKNTHSRGKYFAGFQTLPVAQGGNLHICKHAMDKTVLLYVVGFFPEKNLQGENVPGCKRISVLRCRIGRLGGSSGLHILINKYLNTGKIWHIFF